MAQFIEGWYETREVGEGIWAIDEHDTNTMYLICGEGRCLLLDAGWGVGNLPGLVDGVDEILAGKLIGEPEETFAGNGMRCDFGTCGILYNPDRIR